MKKFFRLSLFVILIVFLSACSKPLNKDTDNDIEQDEIIGFKVTDMKGREIVLNELPKRIVSLLPSNTEIIYAFDAEEKLVGITTYCDYPEETKDVFKIGDFENPNIELIKKLEPDLVLAGGYTKEEIVVALENLDVPVLFTEALDFGSINESFHIMGKLLDREDKAKEILSNMEKTIEEIKQKVEGKEKPEVFYVSWVDPLITAGNGTFIHDIIEIVGAKNIAQDNDGWVRYSVEELVKNNPDMIISAFHATDEGMGKEDIMNNPLFKNLDCVKNGNIYIMKDDNLIARPGPRIIEAVKEMAEAIHGHIF